MDKAKTRFNEIHRKLQKDLTHLERLKYEALIMEAMSYSDEDYEDARRRKEERQWFLSLSPTERRTLIEAGYMYPRMGLGEESKQSPSRVLRNKQVLDELKERGVIQGHPYMQQETGPGPKPWEITEEMLKEK